MVPAVHATPIDPGQDHQWPLPESGKSKVKSPFDLLTKYEDVKNNATQIYVVDGSCYRHEGSVVTGAAALQASTGKKIQKPVNIPSAQTNSPNLQENPHKKN